MKFSVLERVLFITLFLCIAALCLALLFGYRYSFGEQKVEQRGVLVLHGVQKNLDMTLLGNTRKISLPFVDTNIPFGSHMVTLEKKGYVSTSLVVNVRGSEATIVSVDLPPVLLTGQSLVIPREKKDVVTPTASHGVLWIQSGSGRLLTHAGRPEETKTYLPSFLRTRLFDKMAVSELSSTEILLRADDVIALFTVPENSWVQIRLQEGMELLEDKGLLFGYTPNTGELWKINKSTGVPDKTPLLQNILGVETSLVTNVRNPQPHLLFHMNTGITRQIETSWFGDLEVRQIPSKDAIIWKDSYAPITETGVLMSTGKVLPRALHVFVDGEMAYMQTEDLNMYVISEDKSVSFATKLSSPVLSITPTRRGQSVYVQTETSLLYCDALTLRRCDTLAQSVTASKARGIDANGSYLWFEKEGEVTLIPFYSESI